MKPTAASTPQIENQPAISGFPTKEERAPRASLPVRIGAWFARTWQPVFLLLLMAFVAWAIFDSAATGYRWQWYRVWRFVGTWQDNVFTVGPLLRGLFITLQLTLYSLFLAIPIGLLLAGCRLSASPTARAIASGFLAALRNTPLLMQLFLLYFIAAPVFGWNPFITATFSLAAFEGAYMSEIFRAGILALPRSQWEAAYSLGMDMPLTLRHVVLPQAARHVAAPFISQLVSLIKDTSLVSAIAVADLTMRAQEIVAETFLSFETWLLVAALYLCLTLAIAIPAHFLVRKPYRK